MNKQILHINQYIRINEALEDNLFFKLDTWFSKDEDMKLKFINIVTQCRKSKPNKDTIGFMLQTIGFDVEKFVDFIIDNINKETVIDDYLYIMQKTIDCIIANKNNIYNTEEQ